MKKLFLLPTLLLALNLGAATTEQKTESQNDASTAEQTEITETTTDKQTPSFLVRHAEKLKKISYVGDGAFYAGIVGILAAAIVRKISSKTQLTKLIVEPSVCITLAGAVVKILLDTPTKYAMSKKHTFELEALQAQLDAAQDQITEQTTTEKKSPSFLVRHADKFKKVSYVADGAFYAGIVGMLAGFAGSYIAQAHVDSLNRNADFYKRSSLHNAAYYTAINSFYIFIAGSVVKLLLDTPTKYAMSKKHTFKLEALQAQLDAAQQEKVATEKA